MKESLEKLLTQKIQIAFGRHTGLLHLKPLAGDASSRRYHRAHLSGATAPQSVVVMELPAGSSLPLSSEELAIFKEPPQELPFLNLHRFLSRVGVRVPALYGEWVEDRILLLEDLGDRSLWDRVQGLPGSEVREWYEKAIDQLVLLQVGGSRARNDSCIAFQQRFDLRLYLWEFEHFIEYGLKKRPGKSVSEEMIHELRTNFRDMARRLESQPPSLNHRDFHSWNLMIHGSEVVVIDFQDALLAPPQYDLASLLNDRETDGVIGPDLERELIRSYQAKREAMGAEHIDDDEFMEIYLLSAIQRDLKVVGRFYYLDLVKGKPGYKRYIPPTTMRLERNLKRVPRLERLASLLRPYFEEMR